MADEKDAPLIGKEASDTLAVAPPTPKVREAKDADDSAVLRNDPSNESAKLDVALDESFPTSDPPSNTQPGKGKDPAPSSGYDPAAEGEHGDH